MRRRSLTAFILSTVLATALLPSAPAHASPAPDVRCRDHHVAVGLAPAEPKRFTVATTLCVPSSVDRPTIHVLLAGASYGRVYWDFPYRPQTYSYVRALTHAGYATLNIDRIGVGKSSRPPAHDVTIESNAFVAHQLVTALRRGRIGGVRFDRVISVGHSLGVGIAWVEAARYNDVDGVIVTDGMHTPASGLAVAIGSFYPGQLDQRFAERDLPAGYLTTLPGRRGSLFYYEPGAERVVIDRDEATKETATATELATLVLSADRSVSSSIRVPVLSVVGEYDANFCDIPCSQESSPAPSQEAQYYGPEACLEIFIAPRAGHDINLHRSAPIWYREAVEWSDRKVGRSASDRDRGCRS